MNAIAALVQMVQSEPLSPVLVQGATVLILALQGWSLRTTTQMDRRLLRLETAFTGLNGSNGAVGTLKDHAAKFEDVYQKLGETKALAERRHYSRRKDDRPAEDE